MAGVGRVYAERIGLVEAAGARWAIAIAGEALASQVGTKWIVFVCRMGICGRDLVLPRAPSVMQALDAPQAEATHAVGNGPRAALKQLVNERKNVAETRVWLEDARLEAVLGGCRRSLPSVRCVCMFLSWCDLRASRLWIRAGIKCYLAFVKAIAGDSVLAFPPKVEWLQAWAMMFRCSGTFSNYLGYAKIGCILVKEEAGVFEHPAVKRAKDSVRKSGRFAAREKLWIRGHRIEALLVWAEVCTSMSVWHVWVLCWYCCSRIRWWNDSLRST